MELSESIEINSAREHVWSAITNIEHCGSWLSNVKKIEILNQATDDNIADVKWKETRDFCGREASEVMWITEFRELEFYCTRAESHGCVYLSKLSLKEHSGVTTLTMDFQSKPQSLVAKVLYALTTWLFIKSLVDAIQTDLTDIKKYVES